MNRQLRLVNLANDAHALIAAIRAEKASAQNDYLSIPDDQRPGNRRADQLNSVIDDLDAAANVINDGTTYLRAAADTELQE